MGKSIFGIITLANIPLPDSALPSLLPCASFNFRLIFGDSRCILGDVGNGKVWGASNGRFMRRARGE